MKYKKITNIPEASGICFMEKTESFFVTNDEGTIYEIDHSGKILQKKKIGKIDFEGIACNTETNEVYALVENTGEIYVLSPKNLKTNFIYSLDISKKERDKYLDEKNGAEGLMFDGKYFYISTQHKKNNLLKFEKEKKGDKLLLKKNFDIKSEDLSGLTFHKSELYILSDKKQSIYKYDLKKEKIISTKKLEKGSWEGITFDKNDNIFLADDAGSVVKVGKFE
ncbi:MAG: hypothetical protein GY828_03310 [Candidatus Gracilibacteria bacterium]|nr:hypothetical protein [Candidatus Gracilibacteria bacterium]